MGAHADISQPIGRTPLLRLMGTAPGFVPDTPGREVINEILVVSEDRAVSMCGRPGRP